VKERNFAAARLPDLAAEDNNLNSRLVGPTSLSEALTQHAGFSRSRLSLSVRSKTPERITLERRRDLHAWRPAESRESEPIRGAASDHASASLSDPETRRTTSVECECIA
jgi:hypothetical protein